MSLGSTSNNKFSTREFLTKKVGRVLLSLIGLVILSTIIFIPYIPFSIHLQLNDTAKRTITSPRLIQFESSLDRKNTDALRKERASLVPPQYSIDETINKSIIRELVNFFTVLRDYQTSLSTDTYSELKENMDFIPDNDLSIYATFDAETLRQLESLSISQMELLLNRGIQDVRPKQIRIDLLSSLASLDLSDEQRRFITQLTLHFITPNKVLDDAKTTALIDEEINRIQPFTTTYKQGQPIIYKGEQVEAKHIETLKALNIYGVSANFSKFIGIFLIVFLLFLFLERFMYYFAHRHHKQITYFVLIYLIMLFVITLARLLQLPDGLPGHFDLQFFVPIAIVSILVSILVTPNIALLCGTIVSILVTILFKADILFFLYLFMGNAVAAFSSYRRYKRTDLISAGYVLGLFNIVFIVTIGIFGEMTDGFWYLQNIGIGFANGVVSSMIALAILPYLEHLFKITTTQTLLELNNLGHPLMKRLMTRAPGTYQHSLMVANLAEAAAEAIKADPILCRVGAYFHDIGKIKRPSFFTENQFSGDNPHDNLSPRMSKIVIASHPKDGVEMAQKYKLPDILCQFMLEHHGTTLVSFFYTQALHEEDLEDSVSTKEEFRYPGPKPSFKESGIVMLADSVEAAVRSMDNPTLPKIESLINHIFEDKINDNQFSDCPLSLRDITRIKDTFLTLFHSIYHTRLDYQEELDHIISQTTPESAKDPKDKSS